MTVSDRAEQTVTHCAMLAATVVVVVIVPILGQDLGTGRIVGTVASKSGLLPGARVIATKPGVDRASIADGQGRYEFSDLPDGTYTVTAELAGFQTAVRENVVITAEGTATVDFVLEPGCAYHIDYVDLGLPWALQEADAIVHLQISESGTAERWKIGDWCVIGSEHVGTLIHSLKMPPQQESSATTIRFLQEGAGRLPGDRRSAGETPYAPGQEYVAFLRWEPHVAGFQRVAGPLFMFSVQNGRVAWPRDDARGLTNRMAVQEFMTALGGYCQLVADNDRPFVDRHRRRVASGAGGVGSAICRGRRSDEAAGTERYRIVKMERAR
jgi:hypothetical protein